MSQQSNAATLRELAAQLRRYSGNDEVHLVALNCATQLEALAASGTHSLPPQDGQQHGDRIISAREGISLNMDFATAGSIGLFAFLRSKGFQVADSTTQSNSAPPRCDEHNERMILSFYDRPGSPPGNGWVCKSCVAEREQAVAMNESAPQNLPAAAQPQRESEPKHQMDVGSTGVEHSSDCWCRTPDGRTRELKQFTDELQHYAGASCYESDGQDVQDPDNCQKCRLKQIITTTHGERESAQPEQALRETCPSCHCEYNECRPGCHCVCHD